MRNYENWPLLASKCHLNIFSPPEAQAQQVESSIDRPSLVLVKGDTSNSCSFVSTDVLERTADIVQGLFLFS